METAGKLVDNEELRDALKENGIGRPSTRAAIIETLYKRHYIRKERKNLMANPTGIELINLIHEDLLKSAELTGIWEKKLRGIERKTYDARTFLDELKEMLKEIVNSVLCDNTNRRIINDEASAAKEIQKLAAQKKARKRAASNSTPKATKTKTDVSSTPSSTEQKKPTSALQPDDSILGKACPLCGKGIIIKGKTAYGCSEWKNGCKWLLPFKS
jgi:DNA topoisomerase-3